MCSATHYLEYKAMRQSTVTIMQDDADMVLCRRHSALGRDR